MADSAEPLLCAYLSAILLAGLVLNATSRWWPTHRRPRHHLAGRAGRQKAAHGLPARMLLGFADSEMARLVGVDEVEEFPLALVVLGFAGEIAAQAGPERLEPLDVGVAPLSRRPLTFPLTTETHQAGALRDREAVVA